MSARNSHAAKAARRAGRQRSAQQPAGRARIAAAVHGAVCEVTGTDGLGHCLLYAETVSRVLRRTTGAQWLVQGGGAKYGTGVDRDSPEGELCFAWMPSAEDPAISAADGSAGPGGLENGELHAWAARGGRNAEVAEMVDLGARHVQRLSEGCGFGWAREPIPYLWGSLHELNRHRAWYYPDMETTAMCWAWVKANPAPVRHAETLALGALGLVSVFAPGRCAAS